MKKVWCIFEFTSMDNVNFEVLTQTDGHEYESEEEALESIEKSFGFGWTIRQNDKYLILPKYVHQ